MVTLTWQTIISIAAVITAITTVFGKYNKMYDFVRRQEEQDKQIKAIQEEQTILVEGILACLKGLQEQGANGPVTEAITKIEKHLIDKSHGG
jgi:hypothetical protein